MKTIVHLTTVHVPFDARIFYKECRTLAAGGYRLSLIAPHTRRETVAGVEIVPIPHHSRRLARMALGMWSAFRIARELQADVYHFHDPELLPVGVLLRWTTRAQVVYDVHEYLVDSIREKTWLPVALRPVLTWLVERLERRLARSVSGLICAIEDQLPLYASLHCPKAVVHNYPALADFAGARVPDEYEPRQFRLVYIGSLFERRGLWPMLEAFESVAQQIPEAHLFLGGNYEDAHFKQRIESFVAQERLGSRVTLLGRVPFERVKDYLTYAHCAWLPGRMTAQFSNRALSTKIYEAMICGLPMVSADLPHRREFIEPAGAGLLVSPEDPSAHAEAIVWLARHPAEREAMGARGRSWVRERYTWEQESKVLLRLYAQLLKGGSEE